MFHADVLLKLLTLLIGDFLHKLEHWKYICDDIKIFCGNCRQLCPGSVNILTKLQEDNNLSTEAAGFKSLNFISYMLEKLSEKQKAMLSYLTKHKINKQNK